MDKLISLQRAIDAVHKNYDTILDFTSDGKTISSSIEDILSELPSAEPESISEWKKEFREYVDSLDISRDDWKGIIEYIDELPSAEPDTTTHDSIPAETGGNDGDGTSDDCISRQAMLDGIDKLIKIHFDRTVVLYKARKVAEDLPSIQPERKTGHWIPDNTDYYRTKFICSVCGESEEVPTTGFGYGTMWGYCPNCGADMRGEYK